MDFRRLALGLVLGFASISCALAQTAPTVTVKIIGFNDFHGTLSSPGNFSIQPGGPGTSLTSKASGGADYLAGYIASLKAQNPYNVVVHAGDLIGASPLVSAFFHDEGTIEVMNRMGLEFNATGNHEFDEGKDELLRMQNGGCHPTDPNSCKGAAPGGPGTPVPFEGAKFKFLSANVVVTATGRTLFVPYGIKSFSTPYGIVRVGFIGLTLKETPTIVTPSGVAGLQFNVEAATVNALVPKLRARGVEAIVVVIHQGGFQGSNTGTASVPNNYINDCKDALVNVSNSPILGIVGQLDNAVDLVISGHTHTGYNCQLPNAVGRNIPVTQASAFGRVLTDVSLTIDTGTGDVVSVTANNIVVDRTNGAIAPDAAVAGIVAGYNTLVAPLANQVIGTITAPATNGANAAGEMEAGDLIADAQLAATEPLLFGGAVMAFMNAGGVRNPGFDQTGATYPDDVTYQDAFTVQPFGNSLVTMTLTAQQIKDLLEQQFVGCLGQTTQRIMQISNGLSYSWKASAPACSKIIDVMLTPTDVTVVPPAVTGPPEAIVVGGVVQDPTKTYRVTVNNFMATGGDGFTVLLGGMSALGGAQDIDALVAYLAGFKAPNAPYNPADPVLRKPRIVRLP